MRRDKVLGGVETEVVNVGRPDVHRATERPINRGVYPVIQLILEQLYWLWGERIQLAWEESNPTWRLWE